IALADQARVVLGRQFHRRKCGVLTDLVGRDLIRGDTGERIGTLSRFGANAAEPRCRAYLMDSRGVRGLVTEAADHVHVLAERLERLQYGSEIEVAALSFR